MINNLPDGWQSALLSDVSDIVTGKTPSTKNPSNFGGSIPFIKPADLNGNRYINKTADTLTDLGALSVQTIPKNSIPVTCIGNLGKVGIAKEESATNQQINTVIPSSFADCRFLYYQLRTLKAWMQENASATTVTIINKGKFAKAPIALPPLAEQKVIADKLDTLLAQVDNTKARLERIPEILKRFRQSVLAAAVSGKLMQRKEDFYTARKFKDLVTFKQGTQVPVPEQIGRPKIGYERFLRIINYTQHSSEFKYILEKKGNQRVSEDDVVMVRYGAIGFVGRGLDGVLANNLFVIKPKEDLSKDFLFVYLNSPKFKSELLSMAKGATMPAISFKLFNNFKIPLPYLQEQAEIVRRVDQLFAYADTIERQVESALSRVNQLTQSILSKAFRGELTAQWREDNPELISGDNSAEALLERIKAERAAQAPKKRTRKKATA